MKNRKLKLIVTEAATIFTGPLWVMLAFGDIHRNISAVVPLLSYWQVFWPLNLLVTILDQVVLRGIAALKAEDD